MAEENEDHYRGDDAMQTLIGKQLRDLYDSVLVEPLPDKIVELLTKLDDLTGDDDNQDSSGSSSADSDRQ